MSNKSRKHRKVAHVPSVILQKDQQPEEEIRVRRLSKKNLYIIVSATIVIIVLFIMQPAPAKLPANKSLINEQGSSFSLQPVDLNLSGPVNIDASRLGSPTPYGQGLKNTLQR
jgi:hypothetical protein